MGKGARNRAARRSGVGTGPGRGLNGTDTASTAPIGVGRPTGRARAAMRAMWAPNDGAAVVDPWQGYGNAITLGRSKVARWKNGKTKRYIREMNAYLEKIGESGQLKTLEDVVQVAERDTQARATQHKRGGVGEAMRRMVTGSKAGGKVMTGGPSDV